MWGKNKGLPSKYINLININLIQKEIVCVIWRFYILQVLRPSPFLKSILTKREKAQPTLKSRQISWPHDHSI